MSCINLEPSVSSLGIIRVVSVSLRTLVEDSPNILCQVCNLWLLKHHNVKHNSCDNSFSCQWNSSSNYKHTQSCLHLASLNRATILSHVVSFDSLEAKILSRYIETVPHIDTTRRTICNICSSHSSRETCKCKETYIIVLEWKRL